MLFHSLDFLIFFPIVTLVYYLIPNRSKHLWLLAASYYFYMCWNAKYALLMLFSTVVTYASGLFISHIKHQSFPQPREQRFKKLVVAASLLINLSILFFFKYYSFTTTILEKALDFLHISFSTPQFDVLLPVGISFYTFQALGYSIDVYRGDIEPEKNFFRYALFVSFFPQLVAGPIERSGNLLKQLATPSKFSFSAFQEGLLLILWGFFLKIVLADRIAIFVDTVYADYTLYPGIYLIVATMLFAIQIYCDFNGYSIIAIGAARILGVSLMENFDAPYLSTSISSFWRRWHISLTSWFKDYLYIPLGGSKHGSFRKYINKLVVFFVSGLWHGSKISFVVWGALNGLFQIVEDILRPLGKRLSATLGLSKRPAITKILGVLITFILVCFSWIFFRAYRFKDAFSIVRSIFSLNNFHVLFDGSLYQCGLDAPNFWLMLLCIAILFAADICKRRGIRMRTIVLHQPPWFRCLFVVAAVCGILLFGKYGPSFDKAAFIYFQF